MITSALLCFLAVMVSSQLGDATNEGVIELGEILVVSCSF